MNGPYARLYLSLVDDPKFASIYDNDHHFSAWCRLLMIAEPAWPSSAHLPVNVRRASVQALADAGLIDLQPGGRYRIHGLDAERQRRASHARDASNARWNARSIAGASDVQMPSRAEPSRAEQSRAEEAPADAQSDDPAVVYATLFGRPSAKALTWIDDLSGRYGATETGNAIAQAVKDGIGRDRVLGVAESYLADRKRRDLRERKPRKVDPWREELKASLEAQYATPEAIA